MPRRPNSPSSSSPARQLTRARKLRYLQDHEVSDCDFDFCRSPTGGGRDNGNSAASSARSSVEIKNCDSNLTRFSTVLPQPLPLPDLALFLTSDRNRQTNDSFRLPSPEEVKEGDRGRARGRERDRKRENPSEVALRDASYPPSLDSRIAHRDTRKHGNVKKNVGNLDTWLSGNMIQYGTGVDRAQEGYGIQVPFKSAPATAYSSPMLSPQRSGSGDMTNQGSSSPEMLPKDLTSAFPYTTLQENGIFGHDLAPVLNPGTTSPLRAKNTSSATSPVRPKLFIDTSNMHADNNGNLGGHPLPLPPGVAARSPSCPVSQLSGQSSLMSNTSTQTSPNPQISTQSSPHLLSGQSSPSPQITPRPDFPPDTNQWSKGKLIGRGTFGSVYAATNRKTGALCAMKEVELCPDDSKSIESMKQLEQEIKVLSTLKHPNIVQYYGSEIVGDRFYIYLEYVYPGSIDKYVRDHCGAMTESVVRNFTRHILSGLAYLHGTKTIHRDIKGANLLVDGFGVVKLADFGMAKHLSGQAADLSLKGSPYWMAPELMQAVMQKDNRSDLAYAVDIWSLGCTVIEMFTAKPPWNEYEGAAAMFKVLKESPPIPETLSPEGKDFLRCCFQRNPAQRPYASMLLDHPFVRNSQRPSLSNGSHITVSHQRNPFLSSLLVAIVLKIHASLVSYIKKHLFAYIPLNQEMRP
ncbi:hypothetical protein V2J09_021770 [Rumex salicifolius]